MIGHYIHFKPGASAFDVTTRRLTTGFPEWPFYVKFCFRACSCVSRLCVVAAWSKYKKNRAIAWRTARCRCKFCPWLHPYSTLIFWGVPVGPDRPCWDQPEQNPQANQPW